MSDKLLSNSFIADKTSVSIPFLLITSAGADVTGKVAADLTAYYWRQGGTFTSISLSNLAALNSAYSSGGVKEGQNGLYRLDLPDAALASGADWVVVLVICSGAISSRTQYAIESAGTVEIYSRVGAPAGASVSADIAALPSASTIATAVWAAATRTLTSISALAASIASAVLDATASSYNTTGTIGSKINSAAATSGSGASTYTMTINDVNNNALDGVEVWVTSDLAGNSIVASGTTNGVGVVTFQLDPATYYVWCQESGQNFTNPFTITVT